MNCFADEWAWGSHPDGVRQVSPSTIVGSHVRKLWVAPGVRVIKGFRCEYVGLARWTGKLPVGLELPIGPAQVHIQQCKNLRFWPLRGVHFGDPNQEEICQCGHVAPGALGTSGGNMAQPSHLRNSQAHSEELLLRIC